MRHAKWPGRPQSPNHPIIESLSRFLIRHPDRAAALGYLGLTLLFYAPLLLGLRTFPDGDFTHHFLPFSLFQQRALLAGQLPLWNPYTYAGHPFLADIQAAVFYPVSNLVLGLTLPLTAPGARLYFLQVEAILHVALAGFFVYLLVRDLTGGRAAGFLAGVCFAFSGYLTGYPPLQLAILRTAIWLPLVLWLLYHAFFNPQQKRWWIGAAIAFAVAFLAGHPQTFLYISYTVAAWIAFLLIQAWRTRRTGGWQAGPVLAGLFSFAMIFLGLSAVQLWTSLEFTRFSVRANVDYVFVSGGFPLQDAWQLLLPGVLTQFSPLYVGVVGLGLAVLGIRDWRLEISSARPSNLQSPISNLQSSIPLFFTIITLLALLLAYGDNSFLYPLFYRFAPGWKLFRGQERAAFLVALSLSVLAGYGMAQIPHLALRTRRRAAMVFTVLVAGGVYAFGLLWQMLGHSAISNAAYLTVSLVTILLAMGVVIALRLEGWSAQRTRLIVALAVLNLFWANFATNLDSFGPARKTILAPEMAALQTALATSASGEDGLPGRVYNEFRIYEDYGVRQQIEDVWGSSPLRLANYAALFEDFPLDRLWQLTGVDHVLTWRRELFVPSTLLAEFPQSTDTTFLHQLAAPNPRAWMVQRVQGATDAEALRLLADHTFDLAATALLPLDQANTDQGAGESLNRSESAVKVTRLADNRLHVQVEQGGFLVISENWLPGWQVQNVQCGPPDTQCANLPSPISNRSTTRLSSPKSEAHERLPALSVQRVNLTLIGMPIPADVTAFDLVYWPDSVRFGLWISGATLVLLALTGLWQLRRHKEPV